MDFGLRALFNQPHAVVASFSCHRVWLAVVRLPIFCRVMYHTRLLNAAFDSDNLWPVIIYPIVTTIYSLHQFIPT